MIKEFRYSVIFDLAYLLKVANEVEARLKAAQHEYYPNQFLTLRNFTKNIFDKIQFNLYNLIQGEAEIELSADALTKALVTIYSLTSEIEHAEGQKSRLLKTTWIH